MKRIEKYVKSLSASHLNVIAEVMICIMFVWGIELLFLAGKGFERLNAGQDVSLLACGMFAILTLGFVFGVLVTCKTEAIQKQKGKEN